MYYWAERKWLRVDSLARHEAKLSEIYRYVACINLESCGFIVILLINQVLSSNDKPCGETFQSAKLTN